MSTVKAINVQNPSSATVNLTLDTNGNATVGNTIAMGSSFLRNRIINGDMRIDQRNAGAAQTVTTAAAYSIDRWKITPFGASVTSQQVSSGITGTPYVLQITGAASVSNVYVSQRIEANNIADLAGKTVTLSFQTSNSLLTTVNWYANYANSVDNFSTSTGVASGSITVTSTLTSFSVNITLPANASNGLEISFYVVGQTSGTWKLTNVQLEAGTVATPFERRLYGQELALCQRYYYRNTAPSTGTLLTTFGICQSTTSAIGMTQFPVTMRAAPTALEQSGTAAHYQVFASSNVVCSAVPTFLAANVWYATTTVTTASGLSGNIPFWMTAANTAAYLGWSAEL